MTHAATHTHTPPRIERGGWLDALRFIVACLIILHHYELAAPTPLNQFHPVFERGYLLTNFFLMDSGYVLARVYGDAVLGRRLSPGEFFRKRFLRIVPAHLMMVGSLVLLVVASSLAGFAPRHPEWFDWRELPAQVALVQAYGVPGGQGWNAPSWSLSALLGCYVCFPLLIRLTTRGSAWWVLGRASASTVSRT
jgi:peptidoglycan/LPS O-acetylase OafA/YrhL